MSSSNQNTQSLSPSTSSLSSSRLSRFRSRKFIFKVALLGSSLLIFCASLIFAIEHWHHLQLKSIPEWTSQSCRVSSKTLQPNPSNSSQFKITAQVTILHFSQRPVTAYYGPTSNYSLSHQQAQNALNKIQTNTTCYVSNEAPPRVSLLPMPPPQPRPGSASIAWTATFVAAVMAVIQMTFLSHVLHKCITPAIPSPSPHLTSPTQAKTRCLTSRQTTFICRKYAHDLHSTEANDWVCSICLEGHSKDSVVNTLRLPCQHTYHQRCIREWLRKGKSVCPLCSWDAKSLFEKPSADCQDNAEDVAPPADTEQELQMNDSVELAQNGRST